MNEFSKSKSSAKITAMLSFSETGYLKAVYLSAESDGNQETLEKALRRLLKPAHFGWISRLIHWGQP